MLVYVAGLPLTTDNKNVDRYINPVDLPYLAHWIKVCWVLEVFQLSVEKILYSQNSPLTISQVTCRTVKGVHPALKSVLE